MSEFGVLTSLLTLLITYAVAFFYMIKGDFFKTQVLIVLASIYLKVCL